MPRFSWKAGTASAGGVDLPSCEQPWSGSYSGSSSSFATAEAWGRVVPPGSTLGAFIVAAPALALRPQLIAMALFAVTLLLVVDGVNRGDSGSSIRS